MRLVILVLAATVALVELLADMALVHREEHGQGVHQLKVLLAELGMATKAAIAITQQVMAARVEVV
jgi:hypothetical protein